MNFSVIAKKCVDFATFQRNIKLKSLCVVKNNLHFINPLFFPFFN